MIEIAIFAVLGLIAYKSGALSSLGIVPTPSTGPAVTQQAPVSSGGGLVLPSGSTLTGANTGQIAQKSVTGALGVGTGLASGTALGAATAGVGAVVAIGAMLWAAHKQREQQAKTENSAMNTAVQGFDADIKAINDYWNKGQIDKATAVSALNQIMQQFWLLTAKYIQPGRNGCGANSSNGSASCTSVATLSQQGKNPCTGAIGAACCVGCADLYNSLYSPSVQGFKPGAILVLQAGGGVSHVWKVFGSSYGGVTREAYDLTWRNG